MSAGAGLEGRVAIITGAARGIGLAAVERLAADGADIVAFDLPGSPLGDAVKVAESVGRRAVAYEGDVSEDEDATPTFSCQVSRGQARAFARRAEEIVNAGRPVCVLCGTSIDEAGHKCLRRNGHSERSASLG